MHVYQMRSSNRSIVAVTEERLQICMNALREVSKVWLVAKMVHTLFESILGNKVLEERLQKAAGKRHQKSKQPRVQASTQEAPKRKYEEMDMSFTNGPPSHQVSYERSRPQSPAAAFPKDLPPHPQQHMSSVSPQVHQSNDTVMGSGREDTRPTTPFNPSYSFPGTPPDLFLHTRNSPNISEALWQNFQPDQLFPADSNVSIPLFSPNQHPSYIDPQLSRQQQQQQTQIPMHLHSPNTPQSQRQQQQGMQGQQQYFPPTDFSPMGATTMQQDQQQSAPPQGWEQLTAMAEAAGNDDTWSNSSKSQGGPIVPTTLNVEDWYVNYVSLSSLGETKLWSYSSMEHGPVLI